VVINNFNVFRTSFGPAKAHPKLLVDSNAMLTSTITRQRLQLITGWYFKIIQLTCCLKLPNFPQGNALKIDESPYTATTCQLLGILTLERYDHA
jgi:hypothetical protein